jgi:hypothetical protein
MRRVRNFIYLQKMLIATTTKSLSGSSMDSLVASTSLSLFAMSAKYCDSILQEKGEN